MKKGLCIVDGESHLIYRTDCWTFVDTVEEGFIPIYLIMLARFYGILTASLGARALLFFSTWYDQFILTNKWLPTIPIIQPSKCVSTKEEPIQLFSCLQVLFSSTNSYHIRYIKLFFDQIHKNRHIYSILYINQHSKSLFVIFRISFQSKFEYCWIIISKIIIGREMNTF